MKGKFFEDYTLSLLEKEGFKLVRRNYHVPGAEIDLLMNKGGKFYLIEVKYRNSLIEFDHVGSYLRKQYFKLRKARIYLLKSTNFRTIFELWLFLYMKKNKKMVILRRLKLY